MFGEPRGQTSQALRKSRKSSFHIFCAWVFICDTNAGKKPGFVDINSTAVFVYNFNMVFLLQEIVGSAGTGRLAKSSRFERDKFTGYVFAPFVDALTDDRHHIKMRGCRYTAPPFTSSGSVVCRLYRTTLPRNADMWICESPDCFITLSVPFAERRAIKMTLSCFMKRLYQFC